LPVNAATTTTAASAQVPAHAKTERTPWLAYAGLLALPGVAWWLTRDAAPWLTMWTVAAAEFFALKLLTLAGLWRDARVARLTAYLLLWPGMDAAAFLGKRAGRKMAAPTPAEWIFAAAKFVGGLVGIAWAVMYAGKPEAAMWVGWIGMIGLIFSLHFGLMHLASLGWRSVGVRAAPLMRVPIAARSVAEFWGERWNTAFADAAHRFLVRPLARRLGVTGAGALVFLISGLVHESVISLPARGGWGGPTLYFILQGAGIWVEKTDAGRRLGLGEGMRGRLWAWVVTIAPLPLLFHAAFVTRVIVPFFQNLAP
jgi:hypothetical protein